VRDLFKIDTGKLDRKGRRIMVDMMTFDKDYWDVIGNMAMGDFGTALKKGVTRIGGMSATTWDIIRDLADLAEGRAIVDWKSDKVLKVHDTFAQKVMKLLIHETKKLEPISASVFKQAQERGMSEVASALTALLGARVTYSEKDRKKAEIMRKIYSLRESKEELGYYIGKLDDPIGAVNDYNKAVNRILNSQFIIDRAPEIKKEYEKKLLVAPEKAKLWKNFPPELLTKREIALAINKNTYKKPYKRAGVLHPAGSAHKGKEDRVGELRTELKARQKAGK